jgi:hypothetical protein
MDQKRAYVSRRAPSLRKGLLLELKEGVVPVDLSSETGRVNGWCRTLTPRFRFCRAEKQKNRQQPLPRSSGVGWASRWIFFSYSNLLIIALIKRKSRHHGGLISHGGPIGGGTLLLPPLCSVNLLLLPLSCSFRIHASPYIRPVFGFYPSWVGRPVGSIGGPRSCGITGLL